MATGGATADHLHCSVCLEHYKGRNPRLLSCHHSFCEGCLKELVKQWQISCPSCREMTAIKDGDVTNLTINFHLLPFLEETRSFEKKCQFCNLSVAILKCEECTQVLCQDCSESHSKVKRFKDHHVLQLCVIHYEGVSQICLQCVKPACFKCLVLEHQEHEDKVVSYEEGTKLLRENIKKIQAQLEENISCINEKIKEDDLNIVEAEQMVRKYKSKQKELEKQTQGFELIIEVIQRQYCDKEKIQKEREEQRAAVENNRKLADEVKMLDKSSDEHMLSHYVKFTESANVGPEDCLSKMKRIPSLRETLVNMNKNRKLVLRPERVATIRTNETLKLEDITSGTTAWDNSIIIADHGQQQVTQVNHYGEVEGIYPVQEEYGDLWEVCVHGSSLYIGQAYGISQVVDINEPNSPIRKYRLQQGRLDGMCVVSHTKLLCADFDSGIVYQYDPHEQFTKQVLEGLNQPTYINTLFNDDGLQYIVTLQEEHCLKVYNSKWQYQYTVGKGKGSDDGSLWYPGGGVCTDEGILVADYGNNRVCLFDLHGKFVRHYLTEDNDDIVEPNGIVYIPPYLWVLCKKVVMCYKVHL